MSTIECHLALDDGQPKEQIRETPFLALCGTDMAHRRYTTDPDTYTKKMVGVLCPASRSVAEERSVSIPSTARPRSLTRTG